MRRRGGGLIGALRGRPYVSVVVSLCFLFLMDGCRVRRLRLDLEEWVGVLHGCDVWGICLGEVGVGEDSESELSASPSRVLFMVTCHGFGGWKRRA